MIIITIIIAYSVIEQKIIYIYKEKKKRQRKQTKNKFKCYQSKEQ